MHVSAATDDTSIIDELSSSNTEKLEKDITLKTFESCQAFEDVMEDYFKTYWKNNQGNFGYRYFGWPVMEMESVSSEAPASDAKASNQTVWGSSGWNDDFSSTNTQVVWVDESDMVKTDGSYLYYFNETEKAVFILDARNTTSAPTLVKKIHLPENFYNPQLYVTDNRLVIIASGYSQTDYSKMWYYINRNSKTYTIVFDTTDKTQTSLLKLYSSDGDYKESRRIGDMLYVLSNNSFNYPFYNIKSIDDIDIDFEMMLPQKLDISRTDTLSEQNLVVEDKELPYSISTGNIIDCNNISYSLPDEETLKNIGFNPGYTIISSINLKDTKQEVTTKVVAGNNNEIHMSSENLYMTEALYEPFDFSCPPNAMCARPFFWGGTQNTLIHKLNIDGPKIAYQDTTLIPGAPLNQYSMDEYEGNFRIITSVWQPKRSTSLYILDKDLETLSSLENLAPDETFQSSRFIGDKLFLVTFEQIDPLFAIDVKDVKNPKVLWELKIPGFSTYLHPYDANHLIGLGYDTQVNQWGGTQTAGVKIDLYKINYDKKCGNSGLTADQVKKCASGDYKGIIVEQAYTKTIGGQGSYSEALSNPRMFVWNSERKTLLLPATLYERDTNYRTTDYYNGLFAFKIDAGSGISELGKTSHIDMTGVEEARQKECEGYTATSSEPVCRELWNGEMRCESPEINMYVPNYCYKDSTVWQYIGEKSWEYQSMNVKRALYIGENVYGFSDEKVGVYDWKLSGKTSYSF